MLTFYGDVCHEVFRWYDHAPNPIQLIKSVITDHDLAGKLYKMTESTFSHDFLRKTIHELAESFTKVHGLKARESIWHIGHQASVIIFDIVRAAYTGELTGWTSGAQYDKPTIFRIKTNCGLVAEITCAGGPLSLGFVVAEGRKNPLYWDNKNGTCARFTGRGMETEGVPLYDIDPTELNNARANVGCERRDQ